MSDIYRRASRDMKVINGEKNISLNWDGIRPKSFFMFRERVREIAMSDVIN